MEKRHKHVSPTLDIMAKKIFSLPEVTVAFIRDILDLDVVDARILEGTQLHKKDFDEDELFSTSVDVRAKLNDGTEVIIEIQVRKQHYFFTTEKGKAVKARIDEEIASFKEDPKAYQNQVVEKANDYKDLAVDTFQDYKTKFENGDITADDLTKAVQEKTAQVAEFAKDSFELIKEKTAQVTPEQADVEAKTQAMVDDIVIDIKDISEAAAESEAN